MLLFQKRFHEGLVSGAVSITFRRWQRTHVKPGGRYRCHPIGVLVVDAVDVVRVREITAEDARLSGFGSREELVAYLKSAADEPLRESSELFRVRLHHGGDGDRVEIALDDQLTPEDVRVISEKLARMDGKQPWTRKTLRLIDKNPRIAASKLAAKLGRETLPFKVDVRKLKRLGLTQSFEVGYELSPRGRAFLTARPAPARRRVGPGRGSRA
jgi:hypothetical protein